MGLLKIITKSDADKEYLLNCFRYSIAGHTIPGCYGGVNVCPELAYQLLDSEEIKAFRIGRKWKIPKSAVYEYIRLKSGGR